MKLYEKFDPGTYITRDLYRTVCETGDLRVVWAHTNANKWKVDYEQFLALCEEGCSCCGEPLDYGIGKNNHGKSEENTPSTDHKIPRSKGGKDEIENFWIICMQCNTIKNNATHKDIRRLEKIIEVLKETKSG